MVEEIKPKEQYPIEVVAAVEKAFEHPLTLEEANLVREYPELAAVTPDISASFNEQTVLSQRSIDLDRASSANCSTGMSTHHSKTLPGTTFYDMTTTVDFCWDGAYVNWIGQPSTSFANISPTANVEGVNGTVIRPGPPGYPKQSWKVKNENLWGTFNIKYPFNEFWLDAGGNVRTNSSE